MADNPIWIVDVGAAGGIHPRWNNLSSHNKAVLFEPDLREYKKLKSTDNLILLNSALSDSADEIDFHLCKSLRVSSVYHPNFPLLKKFRHTEKYQVLEKLKIRPDTLDNQLRQNQIAEIDFLKIDTQGSELTILQGCNTLLRRVIGVEVEVEFIPLYEKQPLFSDVNGFLTGCGLDLIDLKRHFWKRTKDDNYGCRKGQLVYGDALYFRSPEQVLTMDEITSEKIIRSIFVYLAYGYTDLAQMLLDLASSQDLLSTELQGTVAAFLSGFEERRTIPKFRGKRRLHAAIERVADLFTDIGRNAGSDESLGNPL